MIELNDFKRQWAEIGPAVMAAVERVGASGRYILGPEVERFENELARFWGIGHAVGVGNGMDAIEIGLRCVDLQPGQKVLTTPFSAFATTLAIIRAGGAPVFVDVDDNGNIDLDQSRDAFARDASLRFFVPVHLYGNPLNLEKLERLKTDFDLRIVEDCAQAIGAKFGGRPVGTIGQCAATSFYPTKNLGTLGDGGALLTADADIANRARELRNYGQSSLYNHDVLGLNSRLDELHAATLADAFLPNLQRWTKARRSAAISYLAKIDSLRIGVLQPITGAEPVWHLFPVFARSGLEEVRAALLNCGIRTGAHYPRLIPDQLALPKMCSATSVAQPRNARALAASELTLPVHPYLSESSIDYAVTVLCSHCDTHRAVDATR